VGHVEAGLRTHDKYFPFPEEINRKLTAAIADLHFAPTVAAKKNLIKENISVDNIFVTGNTVIDALLTTVKDEYEFQTSQLQRLDFKNQRVLVVTAHRRENIGVPLENICLALKEIVEKYDDVHIIYPVHLNPSVRDTVFSMLGNIKRIMLLDPLDTEELHNLMARCYLVLTDSGGLQEEAPSLGKPVLVLRDVTERPEAVEAGTVKIIGTDADAITKETSRLLDDADEYKRMANAINPYGDGHASERIVQAILYKFNICNDRPLEFLQ
jgi:UDP-N-acetylglucosamine 2-epimerase (non-hydrolysing)